MIKFIKRNFVRVGKKLLRLFKKFDRRYCHNYITRALGDYGGIARLPDIEHRYLFDGAGENYVKNRVKGVVPYSKIVKVPVKDVIRMQYDKYKSDFYNRYDIPIRLLAIEQIEGKNDYGQSLDNQMQRAWSGTDWQERFENLYKSIKENGFDDTSYIDTDWDMRIVDGSHRLSMALYTNKEFVNIRLNSFSMPDIYQNNHGKDYLYRIGFEKGQIEIVEKKLAQVLAECQYPFVGVLWSPSRDLWDEILKDIQEYDPNNVSVRDWIDVEMTEEEVNGFIKAVYYLDDVTNENLEIKRRRNLHSSRITDDRFPIRIVRLDIKNPYYRVKAVSGLPQSREIIHLKEAIRGHYAPKVYDYERDVIMHIADNYLQSKFIWQLMQINRDLSTFYAALNSSGIEYAIIKRVKDVKPKPTNAALNNRIVYKTDLDILTKKECFDDLFAVVKMYAYDHFDVDWVDIIEEESSDLDSRYNMKLRIKIQGFSIFLFDIQTEFLGLKNEYLQEAIDHRRMDGVQSVIDEPAYDVMIRLADYYKNPKKEHQRKFVQHYADLVTEERIEHAFEANSVEHVKQLFKSIISCKS